MKLIRLPYDHEATQFMIEFSRGDLNLADPSLVQKFRETQDHAPISKRIHLLACLALSVENERKVIASVHPSDRRKRV